MGKTRRAIAEHADRLEFGRVVRVHRERQDVLVAAPLLLFVMVMAGVAALVLSYADEPWLWRLPVLGFAVILWATAAWVWWWPVGGGPRGRHWYVTTERGLIVWQLGAQKPPAIPWSELHVEPASITSTWLTWQEDGRKRVLTVPTVTGRDELLRAAVRGAPSSPRSARRLAPLGAFWLATALVLGFAAAPMVVDVVGDVLDGDRPDELSDLAAVCDGETYADSAPYDGPGPHPVMVFSEAGYEDYFSGLPSGRGPDAVQLVACGRQVGRTPITSCDYQGGYTVELQQGHFRVEIYEVRTGRPVRTLTVDGDANTTCDEWIFVREDDPRRTTNDVWPDESAYATALSPLVYEEAR